MNDKITSSEDIACYAIKGWEDRFENAQSRKYDKLSWVPLPNGHDGGGYKRIAVREDSCEIFTAWILMVQVASRMQRRGLLADNDQPLDATDLAIRTSFPEHIFEKAFDVLTHPKIAWLYCSTTSSLVAEYDCAVMNRIEKKRTEKKRKERIHYDVESEKLLGITDKDTRKWSKAYPACNVEQEVLKAETWLSANPSKLKKNYARFLTNWFGRVQERGGTGGYQAAAPKKWDGLR